MKNLFCVKDNIAIITGASSGIGKYFAITLAKAGAHLILVGRNQERLSLVERQCREYQVNTLAISADVKDSSSVNHLVNQSKNHFNNVDILINAAGIAARAPALNLTEQELDNVIDINLKGTILTSQAIAKWMIATKTPGKIINISSAAAFHTSLTRSAYSASKIAVESFTRSLALSLIQHNIRVNCIAPGFFITEMTRDYLQTEEGKADLAAIPMQRAAEVNELEGILFLLASNASSYMTGSILNVDGGYAIQKV